MNLDKAIQSRKSVKKFKDKKPDWKDIIECIDAMRYAPMAGNNFTLKVVLVSDTEDIGRLSEASQQNFISQAKYVVVVCSNPSRPTNAYEKRAEAFCRQQAGAAIENFLLKIQEKGLATCWIGYFVENQIRNILKIPENIQVEALFPIGYEFGKSIRRKKIDIDRILFFSKYGNKKMKNPKKLNV